LRCSIDEQVDPNPGASHANGGVHRASHAPVPRRTVKRAVRVAYGDIRGIYRSAGSWVTAGYLVGLVLAAGEVIATRSLIPIDRRMKKGLYRFRTPGGTVEVDTRGGSGEGDVFSAARELYLPRRLLR
jgi:hypothetical protein